MHLLQAPSYGRFRASGVEINENIADVTDILGVVDEDAHSVGASGFQNSFLGRRLGAVLKHSY